MIKLASKTRSLSTAVCTVILLIFMCAVGVLTLSKNRDALLTSEGDLKTRVTAAFDDNIVGFDKFISVYGITAKLMGTSVFDDAGYTYVIRDSEDNFHFHTIKADPSDCADNVATLANTLEAEGIPLLYIQAPTKEMDGYTKYPIGIKYESADNARCMMSELTSRGVTAVALSEMFSETGTDPAAMFYRTDHHWTTETAFASYAYIMEKLAADYGFSLDPEMWKSDNFSREYMPQSFIGSIGRRVGVEVSGLDDYTFIEPKFDTDIEVYYPKVSEIYPNWAGDFREAFVRRHLLYSEDVAANRYASYFEYDYGQLIIKNKLAGNDLRVAIVKDSFALPFTAFMSCAVAEVDMIDLREFEGSLTDYLLESKPDIVLILYSNASFKDIMYEFDK